MFVEDGWNNLIYYFKFNLVLRRQFFHTYDAFLLQLHAPSIAHHIRLRSIISVVRAFFLPLSPTLSFLNEAVLQFCD